MTKMIEEIQLHLLEKHFLSQDNRVTSFVYNSTIGPSFYCFAPSQELHRNFWTIVSLGISSLPIKSAIGNAIQAEVRNPPSFFQMLSFNSFLFS